MIRDSEKLAESANGCSLTGMAPYPDSQLASGAGMNHYFSTIDADT